ncbi:hypothetical protein GIB67_012091, partial [Kingdonia uniflora]
PDEEVNEQFDEENQTQEGGAKKATSNAKNYTSRCTGLRLHNIFRALPEEEMGVLHDVLRLNLLNILLSFVLPKKGKNVEVKYIDLKNYIKAPAIGGAPKIDAPAFGSSSSKVDIGAAVVKEVASEEGVEEEKDLTVEDEVEVEKEVNLEAISSEYGGDRLDKSLAFFQTSLLFCFQELSFVLKPLAISFVVCEVEEDGPQSKEKMMKMRKMLVLIESEVDVTLKKRHKLTDEDINDWAMSFAIQMNLLHAHLYKHLPRVLFKSFIQRPISQDEKNQVDHVWPLRKDELSTEDRDNNTSTYRRIGFGKNGLGDEALKAFGQMELEGAIPNKITFLSVLYACSRAGLVQEGLKHFNIMINSYCFTPMMEHYTCMVDLLARSGYLEQALEFIEKKMPVKPDAKLLIALLSSCYFHKNLFAFAWAFGKEKHLCYSEVCMVSYWIRDSDLYATRKALVLPGLQECEDAEYEGASHLWIPYFLKAYNGLVALHILGSVKLMV